MGTELRRVVYHSGYAPSHAAQRTRSHGEPRRSVEGELKRDDDSSLDGRVASLRWCEHPLPRRGHGGFLEGIDRIRGLHGGIDDAAGLIDSYQDLDHAFCLGQARRFGVLGRELLHEFGWRVK